jgi:hypothetical protein
VFCCVGRIAIIVALCCAIELHWVALQSVAWATMIVDYSKRAPLCAAIAQTFDGAHPCSLCRAVSKGKNSEKKSEIQSPVPKIDIICVVRAFRLMPPFVPFTYSIITSSTFDRGDSPPVPPPRSLPG